MFLSPDRYLAPLDSPIERKKILVYDAESKHRDTQKSGFSRVFLMGFYDGETYFPFRNSPEVNRLPWYQRANSPQGCVSRFLRHVLDPDKPEYHAQNAKIYAHNGGRFDSTFILTWLRDHDEYKYDILSVHGRAQLVEVWLKGDNRKHRSWSFTDSVLVLQMSLEKAGKIFCKDSQKLTKFPLSTPEDDPRWEIYNELDCKVLHESLGKFEAMVEDMGGTLGMTAPAISMSTFRRAFQQEPFERHKHFWSCTKKKPGTGCDGCLQEWILESYHGGRTEIFVPQVDTGVHYYDINSSYAASMLQPMPVGKKKELTGWATEKQAASLSKTHVGFVECTVHIPENCHIPPLPYVHRSRHAKKLIFPVGTFSGIWDYDELQLLKDPLVNGQILDIQRSVWFEKKIVFWDFITTLYKLRDKKSPTYDPALSELAKLLMNSLYGKFAMKRLREKLVSLALNESWPKNDDGTYGRPINGDHDNCPIWVVETKCDAPYIIPQISAHITADARIRLWKGMAEIMRQGGRVFYSDSITAGRCVPVKDPSGRTHVLPIARLFELAAKNCQERMDGKQVASLEGWTALSYSRDGKCRWNLIGGIIRHRVSKEITLISTKDGQTEVTRDHGIMVRSKNSDSLRAVSPREFLGDGYHFLQAEIPSDTSAQRIDLFEEVSHARLQCRDGMGFSWFEATEKKIKRVGYNIRKKEPEFERYFQQGSSKLHALLRAIGAFVAEGSSSLAGVLFPTTARTFVPKLAVRHLWAISQKNPAWLLEVKKDMSELTTANLGEPIASTGAYKLHSGAVFLAFLFAVLCGEGHSRNRRLPRFCMDLSKSDFLVLWGALLRGDGSREKCGAVSYTTTSLELASQLSFLLKKYGMPHSHTYRPAKKCWSLRVRTGGRRGQARAERVVKYEHRKSENEFVYDLNVPEAGNFVDALGCVLVHNTDSIMCDRPMQEGTKLGEWKRENPGVTLGGEWVLPKLYALINRGTEAYETEKNGKKVLIQPGDAVSVKMKGVSHKAQTLENFRRLLRGETVEFEHVAQHRTVLRKNYTGPVLTETHKQLRTTYDKRVILDNGETRPLIVGVDIDERRDRRERLIA